MNTLDELFDAMKNRDESIGEWDSLETFGGDEPESGTLQVWSWDDDRLIVGSCPDDIKIISRIDYAVAKQDTLDIFKIVVNRRDGKKCLCNDGGSENGERFVMDNCDGVAKNLNQWWNEEYEDVELTEELATEYLDETYPLV
jgi:hypothetical protein